MNPVSRLIQILERWTAPHPTVTDALLLRQSRFLAVASLAAVAIEVPALAVLAAWRPEIIDDPDVLLYLALGLVALFTFIINRAGYYNYANAAFVSAFLVVTTVAPYVPQGSPVAVPFGAFGVLIVASMFSVRWGAVATAGWLVVSVVLRGLSQDLVGEEFYSSAILYTTTTNLAVLVLVGYKNVLDRAQRAELEFANRKLRESEVMLEQRVAERTEALEVALAEAQRANEVKSQFLASVSHELRTPLNAVINFNQFVATGLYGPVSDKQAEVLEKSTGSARHLLAVINDVLDMSQIEAGKMMLFVEPRVPLRVELQTAADVAHSLVGEKPIEVRLKVPADLPDIAGDRLRIRQILFNLVSNAAKFTRTGEIVISVTTDGQEVVITVADSGPGIAPEQQAAAFEPFRQLSRSGSSRMGTGLGLPITQRLVEAHGGRLWLESEIGRGARFAVALPIVWDGHDVMAIATD